MLLALQKLWKLLKAENAMEEEKKKKKRRKATLDNFKPSAYLKRAY